MVSRLLDALFGCGHKHYSFPITVKKGWRSPAASVTGTYVVCLDCGKEFPYDWKQMRMVKPDGERLTVRSLATKEAA
jgi:predicted transcriptional regulator